MILSYPHIEEIAVATVNDFKRFFYGNVDTIKKMPSETPIDQLAKDYLNLKVSFERLSSDGSLCGITAYCDTEYIITENGITRTIPLKRNQVLLDESFIKPMQIKKLSGKRRFTLAHECAHQILFQMESESIRSTYSQQYANKSAYSLRDLKSREDWNEWQANALGAAILMPQAEIDFAIWRFAAGRTITNYAGYFNNKDRHILRMLCDIFKVSKSALIIRLRQLGYLIDRPYYEVSDPVKEWA